MAVFALVVDAWYDSYCIAPLGLQHIKVRG